MNQCIHKSVLRLFWLAITAPLYCQITVYFVPTQTYLKQWERIGIRVCNGGANAIIYTDSQMQAEASKSGLILATYTELKRLAEEADKTSWQRKALLTAEVVGWMATAVVASDLVEIKEKWKAAIPLFTGGLRFITTAVPQEKPTIPERPSLLQIDAGRCLELELFGVRRLEK